MQADGKEVINLGIGSPDFAPSESTINALISAVRDKNNHAYQSYRGIPELRAAISSYYQKVYKVPLDQETEILPLIGSKEGIMHISMAFINPGDAVLVPNPGYPTYAAVSRLLEAQVQTYDLDESREWTIDFEQLGKFDLDRVKIMWVNFPHMPTGTAGSEHDLLKLIDLATKHRFLIVNDNPYSRILNDHPSSFLRLPNAFNTCLELNSLSKSHNMAGWRIGWLAGRQDYINTVLKVKSNMDSGMFKATQLAAAKAFENSDRWHEELNQVYRERRDATISLLELLGCKLTTPQVGLFLWARIPDQYNQAEAFVDELLYKCHVFVSPGSVFGTNGHRYIRISLCNDVEVLQEVMQRVKQVFNTNLQSI